MEDHISQLSLLNQPPTNQLCPQCASLNLSVDDLIPGSQAFSPGSDISQQIHHATAEAPLMNRPSAFTRNFGRVSASETSFFLQSTLNKSEDQENPPPFASYTGQVFLDKLPLIYQRRRSCTFCWLLYMATRALGLGRPRGYDNLSNLSCAIEWKLDGRHAGAGSITRRLRVFDPLDQYSNAFIVPLDIETKYEDRPTRPSFLSRKVPRATLGVSLVKRWLDICTRCHDGQCKSSLRTHRDQDWFQEFRFIDTQQERLIDGKGSAVSLTHKRASSICHAKLLLGARCRREIS